MPYCNWKDNTYESCYKNDEIEEDLSSVLTQIQTTKEELYNYIHSLEYIEAKIIQFQTDKSAFLQKLLLLVEHNSKRETDIQKCILLMSKLATLSELTESCKEETETKTCV